MLAFVRRRHENGALSKVRPFFWIFANQTRRLERQAWCSMPVGVTLAEIISM
jgi:hypothetical protein